MFCKKVQINYLPTLLMLPKGSLLEVNQLSEEGLAFTMLVKTNSIPLIEHAEYYEGEITGFSSTIIEEGKIIGLVKERGIPILKSQITVDVSFFIFREHGINYLIPNKNNPFVMIQLTTKRLFVMDICGSLVWHKNGVVPNKFLTDLQE